MKYPKYWTEYSRAMRVSPLTPWSVAKAWKTYTAYRLDSSGDGSPDSVLPPSLRPPLNRVAKRYEKPFAVFLQFFNPAPAREKQRSPVISATRMKHEPTGRESHPTR